MHNMSEKQIRTLFLNLCCAKCRNDFDLESIEVVEKIKDIYLCKLVCKKCGSDFGEILLRTTEIKSYKPLEIIDGPPPISDNDVIDAHEFIKKNL